MVFNAVASLAPTQYESVGLSKMIMPIQNNLVCPKLFQILTQLCFHKSLKSLGPGTPASRLRRSASRGKCCIVRISRHIFTCSFSYFQTLFALSCFLTFFVFSCFSIFLFFPVSRLFLFSPVSFFLFLDVKTLFSVSRQFF